MASIDVTAADRRSFAQARAAGREAARDPSSVLRGQYDVRRDAVSLWFQCGATIVIPRALIPELEGASKSDLRSIRASLDVLECRPLDVDIFVPGLVEHVFGARLLAAATGRRGGKRRSKIKAAAARVNGSLGGRPRNRRST